MSWQKLMKKIIHLHFFLLDEPGVYSTKTGLSLVKGGLFIVLLSIGINFLFLAIRDRDLLFKPNKDIL